MNNPWHYPPFARWRGRFPRTAGAFFLSWMVQPTVLIFLTLYSGLALSTWWDEVVVAHVAGTFHVGVIGAVLIRATVRNCVNEAEEKGNPNFYAYVGDKFTYWSIMMGFGYILGWALTYFHINANI